MDDKLREWESMLGRNIKDYLQAKGIGLTELSLSTGIPKSTLSDWMNYKRSVKLDVRIKKLSNTMNVSVDDLCFKLCFRSVNRTLADIERISKYVDTKTHSELPDSFQLALDLQSVEGL